MLGSLACKSRVLWQIFETRKINYICRVSSGFLGLNGPPISITFPFFIAALVPIREKLLPTFLTAEELEILDPFDPTDEPEQGGEGGVGLRSASDLPS